MKRRGIVARWYLNVFAIITTILLTFDIVASIVMYTYYYNSMEDYLKSWAATTTLNFNRHYKTLYADFYSGAQKTAEEFDAKDKIELQIIDVNGTDRKSVV